MVGLGMLQAPFGSFATGVSADGSTIVGNGRRTTDPLQPEQEAFRWTSTTGMVGLGPARRRFYSEAFDVSSDGSVIVGRSLENQPDYTRSVGLRRLAWSAFRRLLAGPFRQPKEFLERNCMGRCIWGIIPWVAEPANLLEGQGVNIDGWALARAASYDGLTIVGLLDIR